MKKIIGILLIICILITGCWGTREISGFFAWMDGYLAMGEGEEFSFALTFFYEQGKTPFDAEDIKNLSFYNLDQIEISDYEILPLDIDNTLEYDGYSFNLTINAKEQGLFKTDQLIAEIGDSSVVFPIGNWTFDIEEINPSANSRELIDIWDSPAAGSNPETFAYDYKVANDSIKIKEIWISENNVLSSDEELGLPLSNVTKLPKTLDAPINFIRPKVILSIDGTETITFGMSYYSGAVGIGEDVLERSRERNRIEL